MNIIIGSDHSGYALKESLKDYLKETHNVIDIGPYSESPVDFPDYAIKIAREIAAKNADLGIMIDGIGSSSAIACNKIFGIRAAVLYNEFSAKISKEHSNANVICLGSKLAPYEEFRKILDAFFNTDFLGGKYQKRLDKISSVETENVPASVSQKNKRKLVTETDLRESRRSKSPLILSKSNTMLTPAAKEYIDKNPSIAVWEP